MRELRQNWPIIVIGAGLGGLVCASKLAQGGKRVLLLEKIHHVGGTSHVFKRQDYLFPMGPLSFSYPTLVNDILQQAGLKEKITFKRCHFQLLSPHMDVIYSEDWDEFRLELIEQFADEERGINTFFSLTQKIVNSIKNVHEWHHDYTMRELNESSETLPKEKARDLQIIETYDKVSSRKWLDEHLSNPSLKKLLGSQGTYEPIMSMVHLAFMWNVMSFEGIWFPTIGIDEICNRLKDSINDNGGVIKLLNGVSRLKIKNDKVSSVITNSDDAYQGDWVVANADYKTTFLNLIGQDQIDNDFFEKIDKTPYTGSELCVYLGIEPSKVDLSKMRATHMFYRALMDDKSTNEPTNFKNKEIEACLWSNKSPRFVPEGKKSLILRVNMPYDLFEEWRTGEKKRKQGYKQFKTDLAWKLIGVMEKPLPGLSSAIETIEIATPLTYRDWGKRHRGSVAGWSRDIKKIQIQSKLLCRTPIQNLFMVGIYSVIEPFLGGVPVSVYTGNLVADHLLNLE